METVGKEHLKLWGVAYIVSTFHERWSTNGEKYPHSENYAFFVIAGLRTPCRRSKFDLIDKTSLCTTFYSQLVSFYSREWNVAVNNLFIDTVGRRRTPTSWWRHRCVWKTRNIRRHLCVRRHQWRRSRHGTRTWSCPGRSERQQHAVHIHDMYRLASSLGLVLHICLCLHLANTTPREL